MSQELALSRTTRLINRVFFDGIADENAIGRGLTGTTIRLVGDEPSMSSRAGQAALVTSFQLIARMGIGIELVVPDVRLVAPGKPPLREATLASALLELGADLIPGTVARSDVEEATAVFAFGDGPYEAHPIYVTASEFGCCLTRDAAQRSPISADCPIGGLAAGAAVAAVALEVALPNIERATQMSRSARTRPFPGPPVDINLRKLFPNLEAGELQLGRLDAISAGAITSAFVDVLHWLPNMTAEIRAIDGGKTDPSNLNRYPQLRASEDPIAKVESLSRTSNESIKITGVRDHYTQETREGILPLAEQVLVGVDDVPSRWRVQDEWPADLYVGATNNHEAIVTTHHPGEPCAGCAHPDPVPTSEDNFIPTISFVSFWAGLLQACALLAETKSKQPARRVTVYPFGLGGDAWGNTCLLSFNQRCAIACQAA